MTNPPTDRELAQAYLQGYQDGRRGQAELVAALQSITGRASVINSTQHAGLEVPLEHWSDLYDCVNYARAALAKVAQPQPATKGE